MAFVHKAALDFVSKTPRTKPHRHVLHMTTNFFRPTLPTPKGAVGTTAIDRISARIIDMVLRYMNPF